MLHLLSYTAVTGLGRGNDALASALAERRSALAPCRFETVQLDTMVAEVDGLDDVGLRADLAAFDCRNNRLAQVTLEQDGLGDAVRTATAQMEVIGKRHYGLKAVPAGGGGGRQPTRELFDTLLLWQPRVALDDHGDARVTVPDDLELKLLAHR